MLGKHTRVTFFGTLNPKNPTHGEFLQLHLTIPVQSSLSYWPRMLNLLGFSFQSQPQGLLILTLYQRIKLIRVLEGRALVLF